MWLFTISENKHNNDVNEEAWEKIEFRKKEEEKKLNTKKDSPGISMITIIIIIIVLLFIFLFLIYTLSVSSIAENDVIVIINIRLVCVKLQ